MKHLKLILPIFTLIFAVAVFSSFTPENGNGENNGNIITIDNGANWIWVADNCIAETVPSLTSRVQRSSKGFYSAHITFQLPEGHCDIPAKGATVTRYSSDSWAIINSKGKVNGKIIFRPNN